MNKLLIFIFCTFVVFSSCKKATSKKDSNAHGLDVYIMGQCGVSQRASVGGYWKNGVFNAITDTNTWSYARSMTVSSNDVYIVGYYFNSGNYNSTSAYWKNGTMHPIPDAAAASCVTINGADVYIGGASNTVNGVAAAAYWKNGVKHALNIDSFSSITSIFVKGNDVYMIVSGDKLEYWLNDRFVAEADIFGNEAYGPRGSYVNGNDVYFCGQIFSNGGYNAAYWKNGVYTQLGNSSQATSIKVAGTDIYCSGYTQNPSGLINACYWKNGVDNKLDDLACANSLAIDGTDLYIGGYIINGDINLTGATYWINGKRKDLSNPYYKTNNIYTSSSASQIVLARY